MQTRRGGGGVGAMTVFDNHAEGEKATRFEFFMASSDHLDVIIFLSLFLH
jgi:hypothetical protein